MYEIRIHGRGGQGVKTTAHVLGRAGFLSGFETQDFAVYGAERRGAPVASFCRMDRKQVLSRGYIFNPDAVIIMDPTIDRITTIAGLKKKGIVLVNSEHEIEGFRGAKFIDATKIAIDSFGKPIPSIAILGAFIRLSGIIPMENLKKAIKTELAESGHKEAIPGNIKACQRCFEEIGE